MEDTLLILIILSNIVALFAVLILGWVVYQFATGGIFGEKALGRIIDTLYQKIHNQYEKSKEEEEERWKSAIVKAGFDIHKILSSEFRQDELFDMVKNLYDRSHGDSG